MWSIVIAYIIKMLKRYQESSLALLLGRCAIHHLIHKQYHHFKNFSPTTVGIAIVTILATSVVIIQP